MNRPHKEVACNTCHVKNLQELVLILAVEELLLNEVDVLRRDKSTAAENSTSS